MFNKQKIFLLAGIFVGILTTSIFSYADTPIKIFVNNKQLETDAIMINDHVFVPIRFIAENLGAKIDWDEQNNAVKIFTNNDTNNQNQTHTKQAEQQSTTSQSNTQNNTQSSTQSNTNTSTQPSTSFEEMISNIPPGYYLVTDTPVPYCAPIPNGCHIINPDYPATQDNISRF